MLTTLRSHRDYARLLAAQVSGLLGSGVLTVALALLAADLAGDRAAAVLSTALAVKIGAYVVLGPLVASAVRRLAPVRVLVGADVVRVLVALALPLVGSVWQVYLLVLVLQSASAAFTPAYQALLPRVLPDADDYRSALSLSRLAYDGEAVLSPLLASLALLVLDARALFVVTALGFVGSAVCVLAARPPGAVGDDPGRRVGRGVVVFLRRPGLRRLLALDLVVASAYAATLVLTASWVRDLGRADAAVGVALGVFGAGSVVAAVLVSRSSWSAARLLDVGAATTAVVLVLGVVLVPTGWPGLLVVWAGLGLGIGLVLTPSAEVLRREVGDDDLGPVLAGHFAWSHACYLLTYPLAGQLGSRVGLDAGLAALAVAACLGVALAPVVGRGGDWRRDPSRGEPAP